MLEDEHQVEQEPEAHDEANGAVQDDPSVDVGYAALRLERVKSLDRNKKNKKRRRRRRMEGGKQGSDHEPTGGEWREAYTEAAATNAMAVAVRKRM